MKSKKKEVVDFILDFFVFCLVIYFFIGLFSFMQFLDGEVSYSPFWHLPFLILYGILFYIIFLILNLF